MKHYPYRELFHQALFNGNGIARRLIVALILFSTLITTIITTIQLYNEYQSDVKGIHESFSFIRQSTLPVLRESVWVNDTAQIKSQINGLLNLRDMEYIAIRIDGREHWSAGQQISSRTVTDEITMTRQYRDKQITIGQLFLTASLDKVWQRLWDRLLVVVIDNGIKTLLVALFMMLVFQILVTRHLVKLSYYARNIDPECLDGEDLQLDRPPTGHWRPDALDHATQAINDMRHRLQQAYQDMQRTSRQLHESEERLRLAMQVTNEGVWDWSIPAQRLIFNPAFCRMLGYEIDELEPAYASWESRLHPDDREVTLAKLQAHLEGKIEDYAAEHRLRTRSGEWLWVLGRGAVIERDAQGRPLRMVGTLKDIDARKKIEAQLKQLNEELEQRVSERTTELQLARDEAERASKAKSSFLSRMSHELRTPMNAILGFAQLLDTDQKNPLAPEHQDSVQEILNAGQHLLKLINEVLDLARIESGRLSVESRAIEVEPVINECLTLVKPLADQQAIRVSLDIEANCVVLADRMRLSQVILNLLSNAIKYNTRRGSVAVTARHSDDQHIRISIRDTGMGIKQADIQHLFVPFERLEQSSATVEGTGVGLALSKLLTEAMQGQIGVDSEPGKGSTFWLTLPAADKVIDGTPAENTARPGKAAIITKSHHRLLYVEDNPANLKLMQSIVHAMPSLEMLSATTAEDGLNIALEQQPDLIFMDITLPGMDGYAALQQLQASPLTQQIPVIAVSANAMVHDMEKGQTAGFAGYIIKPFDLVTIRETLSRFLNLSQ